MKKIVLVFISIVAFTLSATSQQQLQLTQNAQISVITIAPGDELADSFGHSAFRVRDTFLSIDYVYNYGVYNFNTPNFYAKFAQGKLLYDLGISRFERFLNSYKAQNRTIVEQILHLTTQEKQSFFEFLQHNAKPENKSYLYDFFFDNCATKLRDVSDEILTENIQLGYDFDTSDFTFRNLIHNYLDEQPWGKFGIDLALGSVIDRKATPQEYLFLPDYEYESFKKGSISEKPLVRIERTLFKSSPVEKSPSYFTPLVTFIFVGILVVLITFRDIKRKQRSKWLDVILFLFTGIVGLLVLLLWFATDHSATQKNYNFLWAFLPNLPLAFLFLKTTLNPWLEKYLILLLVLLFISAFLWVLKIQVFSIALIPILVLLGVRYLYLIKYIKSKKI